MKPFHLVPVLLLIPFTFQGINYQKIKNTDNNSVKNNVVRIEISRARADELISKLSIADPWIARQDGSALAWGEAATLETLDDMY